MIALCIFLEEKFLCIYSTAKVEIQGPKAKGTVVYVTFSSNTFTYNRIYAQASIGLS
jgi:hypothetical protein